MCLVARMIEDGRTYWPAGGGTALLGVLLGKQLYAPGAVHVTEDGVIGPEPLLPFDPMMTMISTRATNRALAWGTMNTAGLHAQLGFIDYGVLHALQIDQYGNINSTQVGIEGENARRFGGPGGADTIAACCWRTIVMTDQEQRKFVKAVDFISSPGYLDGTLEARMRAGLPDDTGPWRVVTPMAVYDYDERRLRLIERAPWVTVEDVMAECSFRPLVADPVREFEPPTEEELQIIRTQLDIRGQASDASAAWITWDGDKYVRTLVQ